jgi:hypothetical protein
VLHGVDVDVGERAIGADARVGDEDVDRPQLRLDALDRVVDLGAHRDVGRHDRRGAADRRPHRLEVVLVAGQKTDARALGRSLLRHGPSDTARGARHQRSGAAPLHAPYDTGRAGRTRRGDG